MHPIAMALRARGWTQQELVDRVNRLKPRRTNGRRIRLTQGHLSSIISDKLKEPPAVSVPLAKAIASVLELDPAAIVLYERGEQPKRRSA